MSLNYAESVSANVQALKEYYTNDMVESSVYGEGALYGLIPKFTKFSGKNLPIPLIYGNPQGASAVLATAIANKSNSQEASFALRRFKDYAVASVEREAKLASEMDADKGAWLELAKVAVDGALNTAARSQALALYGDGTGVRGQISATSTVTGTSITLSDINDVTNFEVYMYVQFSATRGGGTVRTGQAQITSIDRNTGVIRFGANLNSLVTSAAAGDYIVRAGDYGAMFPGLQGWLVNPANRPTAAGQDNFFTQDRFPDMTRLMGVFHDGTSQPIEEAVIDLERKCARENARITHIFINNVQYSQLLKSLQTKAVYDRCSENARGSEGSIARVSFAGVEFAGAGGPVRVFPDFNCPSKLAFGLNLKQWKLYSLDTAPHIFDRDNDQEMLRDTNNDSYEIRCGSYSALGCRNPGGSGFAVLQAAV